MNRRATIAPPAIALTINAVEIASRPLHRSGCSSGPDRRTLELVSVQRSKRVVEFEPEIYERQRDHRKARPLYGVPVASAAESRVHHHGDIDRVPEDQRLRSLLFHHLIDCEEIAGTDGEVEAREGQ